MKEIIFLGLRNNFKEYKNTRHNAGAIVLKELENYWLNTNINFLYSPGYMNLSGDAITKIPKDNNFVFVFVDDVTIPIGEFKISFAEGASSHNGIKSIAEKLKTKDFYRVRIGIGKIIKDKNNNNIKWKPLANEMSDYVLSNLSQSDVNIIKNLSLHIAEKLKILLNK